MYYRNKHLKPKPFCDIAQSLSTKENLFVERFIENYGKEITVK